MKKIGAVLVLLLAFSFCAKAEDIENGIKNELGIDTLEKYVPESILENGEFDDLEFSYSGASETVEFNTIIKKLMNIFFSLLKKEAGFIFSITAFLIVSGIYTALSSGIKSSALTQCFNFTVSVFICVMVYGNILTSLESVTEYVNELSTFMLSLTPFMATAMCMQGAGGQAALTSVSVISVIAVAEKVCVMIVVPLVKILFAFICAGFVSKINFSAVTDFISSFASKLCVITMSILSAILYFKHSLASSADSLALRSLKLLSGNFIPIVGGMVSETSSTLIAGIKLVKNTLGIFMFAVLLYMTLTPVITFALKKISLRILSAFSSLMGADDAAKIMSSVYGVYNILYALMLSLSIFFIITVAIFVKGGG